MRAQKNNSNRTIRCAVDSAIFGTKIKWREVELNNSSMICCSASIFPPEFKFPLNSFIQIIHPAVQSRPLLLHLCLSLGQLCSLHTADTRE